MTLETIQGIIVLADLLSFSNAAAMLNITQPAFSRMISRAEEELGFMIFERSTRDVNLTREGESFVSSLRQVEAMYKSAVNYSLEMQAEKNRLILGVAAIFVTFDLLPHVVQFSRKRPDIHLDCIPMSMGEIPMRLRSRGIDIGFLFTERTSFGPEFSSRVIKRIPLDVVANELHPFAKKSSIHPRELVHEQIITLQVDAKNYDFGSYGAPLATLNKKHGLRLETSIIAVSIMDSLMRVACNSGITLLTSTLGHIVSKNTVMIPLIDGVELNLTAIWRKKEVSREMRTFLNSLNDM